MTRDLLALVLLQEVAGAVNREWRRYVAEDRTQMLSDPNVVLVDIAGLEMPERKNTAEIYRAVTEIEGISDEELIEAASRMPAGESQREGSRGRLQEPELWSAARARRLDIARWLAYRRGRLKEQLVEKRPVCGECISGAIAGEQVGDVLPRVLSEARRERVEVGVGPDPGAIEEEFLAPDQPGFLAELHDPLEEALKDVDAEPRSNPGQTGMIGQWLIQGVPDIPAMGKVQARCLDELALGAEPFEKEDELQLEKDDWVDTRAAAFGVQVAHPVAHEA